MFEQLAEALEAQAEDFAIICRYLTREEVAEGANDIHDGLREFALAFLPEGWQATTEKQLLREAKRARQIVELRHQFIAIEGHLRESTPCSYAYGFYREQLCSVKMQLQSIGGWGT